MTGTAPAHGWSPRDGSRDRPSQSHCPHLGFQVLLCNLASLPLPWTECLGGTDSSHRSLRSSSWFAEFSLSALRPTLSLYACVLAGLQQCQDDLCPLETCVSSSAGHVLPCWLVTSYLIINPRFFWDVFPAPPSSPGEFLPLVRAPREHTPGWIRDSFLHLFFLLDSECSSDRVLVIFVIAPVMNSALSTGHDKE